MFVIYSSQLMLYVLRPHKENELIEKQQDLGSVEEKEECLRVLEKISVCERYKVIVFLVSFNVLCFPLYRTERYLSLHGSIYSSQLMLYVLRPHKEYELIEKQQDF